MRTDVSKKVLDSEQKKNKTSESVVETMKTRKTLHPIQEAAGDKENLVRGGVMPPSPYSKSKPNKLASTPTSSNKLKIKKEHVLPVSKTEKKITAEDLTSQAGPSEHYWEVLAERRRTALEKALEENCELHEKIVSLTAENDHYKELLEESKALIDTLTELIGPIRNAVDNSDDSFTLNSQSEDESNPQDV